MPGNDLFFFREVTGKLLDHVDGTVLSTRAAERNSKVTPVVAPEGGQPFFDKFTDVFQQLGDVSLRFEKFDNRLVFSGQWPQSHVVIRVRQASYVKNNVCIKWDTEFETEGFEMKRQRRLFDFDQFLDPVAQSFELEFDVSITCPIIWMSDIMARSSRMASTSVRSSEREVPLGSR